MLPSLSGKSERGPTLSCPPQGKLPSLSSSKPRALGETSWKWQEAKGARKMRARKQLNFVMFCFVFFFFWWGGEGGVEEGGRKEEEEGYD